MTILSGCFPGDTLQALSEIWKNFRAYGDIRKRQAKRLSRHRRLQTPEHDWTVRETVENGAISLSYGPNVLSFGVSETAGDLPEIRDHNALALAAISMSYNAHLTYDGPVSEDMALQIDRLAKAYRLWSISKIAPLRLSLTNVVRSEAAASKAGLICLSGGLDSLYAGVRAAESGNIRHALLVAGLDYDSRDAPGFVELQHRVGSIADMLGFEMQYAHSDIKRSGFAWNYLHGVNLGACLNLFSNKFGFGVFAQDNTSIQDLQRHPWGNNGVLHDLMSTRRFSVETIGKQADRVEKLRYVIENNERVLQHLSVCFADRSIGGNCGYCDKCCQTRAAFEAIGASDAGIFQSYPDLAGRFREMAIPSGIELQRGMMCRTAELVDALPDGPTRGAVVELETRLHEAFVQSCA